MISKERTLQNGQWEAGRDQYAATFGGVNYMEFYAEASASIVNPLRVKQQHLFELENNLLLYYTATSRESAKIIEKQSQNVVDKKVKSIEAMHQLKLQAQRMKEALLKGRIHEIGEILDFGFRQKQQMAEGISNAYIDNIYEQAKKAGATGGKISGAGGGGFMTFYCPAISKYKVMEALSKLGGHCQPYQFTGHGMTAWTVLPHACIYSHRTLLPEVLFSRSEFLTCLTLPSITRNPMSYARKPAEFPLEHSLTMKCPRCRRGAMFTQPNPWKLKQTLKMPDTCPECRQPFELEVGFWYGTGYVSYGLSFFHVGSFHF